MNTWNGPEDERGLELVQRICGSDGAIPIASSSLTLNPQITREHSCDRRSGAADPAAPSLYDLLYQTYQQNDQNPLKWQYFGSEAGVANQYPAGRAPDCTSYDHRFR